MCFQFPQGKTDRSTITSIHSCKQREGNSKYKFSYNNIIWFIQYAYYTFSCATVDLASADLWLALRLRQAECMLRWTRLRSALTCERSRSVADFISENWRRKETTALHRDRSLECSAEKYSLNDCSYNWEDAISQWVQSTYLLWLIMLKLCHFSTLENKTVPNTGPYNNHQ